MPGNFQIEAQESALPLSSEELHLAEKTKRALIEQLRGSGHTVVDLVEEPHTGAYEVTFVSKRSTAESPTSSRMAGSTCSSTKTNPSASRQNELEVHNVE